MKYIYLLVSVLLFACKNETSSTTNRVILLPISHRADETQEKMVYSSDQIEFLKKIGLIESKTFNDNLALADQKMIKYYFDKYQLKFLSDRFLNNFLKEKELNDYKGIIPPNNIDEFKTNLEKFDSSLNDYYFIRISLIPSDQTKRKGLFLQKINMSEIVSNKLNDIQSGPSQEAHGQSDDNYLKLDRLAFYMKKYKIKNEDDIIVDHVMPEIKIVAPKEDFNMNGKTVDNDNNIISIKDPAIIFKVKEGWICLTTWK